MDTTPSYDRACFAYRSYQGDAVAECDALLAQDPEQLDAHLLRACALVLSSERQYQGEAAAGVSAAQALAAKASPAQQAWTAATAALVSGQWYRAGTLLDETLALAPTHVVALQTAHVLDFMLGDATNLRNRPGRALLNWPAEDLAYSYVQGMYAFGLEECNEFDQALAVGERAVAADPRDAWATHAVAHVLEMRGEAASGERWLADSATHWHSDCGMACHNWWHKALFHIDLDDVAAATAIVDDEILPNLQGASLELLDVSSMLLRLKLLGVAVEDRAQGIAAQWAGKLEQEPGYYAFNDVHAGFAFLLAGDLERLAELKARAQLAQPRLGETSARMSATIGVPILSALLRLGADDAAGAADLLEPVRAISVRFGGSNAQRDILNWLLIDASARAGRHARALQLLDERRASRPEAAFSRRWREQLRSA
ncbi:MAG: tetratricopeptide repeat protein [Pseudomonadota bacterium]